MAYLIYLRKSRADMEAESRGDGETLARHEKTLLDLAKRMSLPIGQIYKEIVSGETIAARPVMQQLILEVEQGLWDGVVVMEVERLARGDTKDQGIVAETFKYSDTKIITPVKTYDPSNEFDEEYFEFGLFMSRREFKTINRRIQRGRIASVKEGKWIYSDAPYGYKRVKLTNDKGYTLEPVPDDAKAVQLIYELYTLSKIGSSKISKKLNELGYVPRSGKDWSPSSIRDILKNIAYAGYVKKGERPEKKYLENGVVIKKRVYNTECLIAKGLHPAIVSLETFNLAQEIMKSNTITSNNGKSFALRNPLAGLLECSKCGRIIQMNEDRKRYREESIFRLSCPNQKCENISSKFDFIEDAVLEALSEWLFNFKLSLDSPNLDSKIDITAEALQRLENEKLTLATQVSKLHDLLEQGVYNTETFLQRNSILSAKISDIDASTDILQARADTKSERDKKRAFIPKVENVLQSYYAVESAEERNILLKTVIDKILYTKTKKGKGFEKAFTVEIFPRMDTF